MKNRQKDYDNIKDKYKLKDSRSMSCRNTIY